MSHIAQPITDNDIIIAKEVMKTMGYGYVVEAVENHFDMKESYVHSFKDSSQFSQAFVDDLLDCLSLSFEQNQRILAENDLQDVFK